MFWFKRKKREHTPFEEFNHGRCVARVWLNRGLRGRASWRVSVGRLLEVDGRTRLVNSFDVKDLADLEHCLMEAVGFLAATSRKGAKRRAENAHAIFHE